MPVPTAAMATAGPEAATAFAEPPTARVPALASEAVALAGKNVPHFKPGKDLRERVNESRHLPVRD